MLVETKPYSNRKVVIPGRLEIHAADDAARFVLRIAPEKLARLKRHWVQSSRLRSVALRAMAILRLPASDRMNGISGQMKARRTPLHRPLPSSTRMSRTA